MKLTTVLIATIATLSMVFSIVAINRDASVVAEQVAKSLGGTTNFDDLVLSGDATVGDDLTVGGDLILTDNDFCIDFFATSTATQNKMYASTTATIEGSDGVIMFAYGSCAE